MTLGFNHPHAVSVERRDVRDPATGIVQDTLVIATNLQSDAMLPGYDASELEVLVNAAVEYWKSTGTAYDATVMLDRHVPIGELDYGRNDDGTPSRVWLEFYGGRLSLTYPDREAARSVKDECDRAPATRRPERDPAFVRTDWIGAGHRLISATKKDGQIRKAVRFGTDDQRWIEASSRTYDHDAIMRWVAKYIGYDGPPLPED